MIEASHWRERSQVLEKRIRDACERLALYECRACGRIDKLETGWHDDGDGALYCPICATEAE